MKLVTRVLIIVIAFFMSASVIDAQNKGQRSIGKSKDKKTKQVNKSKFKSSNIKAKTGKGKKENYQQSVITPMVKEAKYKNGESFESNEESEGTVFSYSADFLMYTKITLIRFSIGLSDMRITQ